MQTLLLVNVFDADAIGRRIAEARDGVGLSQEELADLVGVSTRSLQGYEAGARIPFKHMQRIAEATRAEWGWLLHGDAATPPVVTQGDRLDRLVANQQSALDLLESLAVAVSSAAHAAESNGERIADLVREVDELRRVLERILRNAESPARTA